MRILVVHNYYQHKGGEDVVFEQEVEALKKTNTVETIIFNNQKGIKGYLQFALYPWNIFIAHKIVTKAKEFRADIVHFHNIHYAIGPLGIRALHKAGFKIIQTLHNYRLLDPSATLFVNNEIFLDNLKNEFPWKSIKMRSLDDSLFKTFWVAFAYYIHLKLGTWRKIDRYLVFSNFMKGLVLKSAKKIQEHQIAIKTNAINKPKKIQENRHSNFVYIGRLSVEKGIDTLLEAFTRRSDLSLHIYGDGPLVNKVNKTCSKNSNIQFKGFQQKEALNQALAQGQALIVPSIWFEGMPMTILEAYALGTPVISSKIGALEEMIIDGVTGFHFTPCSVENLIAALDKYESLPTVAKQTISHNCLNEYENKYQMKKNIQTLEHIYLEVIQEI